jgi:Amt family ammonium transporter
VIGLIAGAVCAAAISLKYRLGFDDSLDVVGVHAVGGIVGSLAVGLFATGHVGQTAQGLFYGGGFGQLGRQAMGVVVVGGYSFVLSWLLGKAIQRTIGFRVAEEVEVAGVDQAEHAESAYDFSAVGASLARTLSVPAAERPVERPATKTAERPAAKPAVSTAAKPAEKPAAKTADRTAEKPADKPADKPSEKTEVDTR